MKGKIIDIEYGNSIPIKIQISEGESPENVKESLARFKETETFKEGEWSDDELLEHLESDAVEFEFVPAFANETIYLSEL